jgi:hypothetical protein
MSGTHKPCNFNALSVVTSTISMQRPGGRGDTEQCH